MDKKPVIVPVSRKDIILFLFKQKFIFIGTVLFITSLVSLAVYFLPPDYTAKSSVLVERTKSPTMRTSYDMGLEMAEVINTEIEIASSRTVMKRVVEKLKLHELPSKDTPIRRFLDRVTKKLIDIGLIYKISKKEKWIKSLVKHVKFKQSIDSDVFTIKYGFGDPKMGSLLVNTITDEYIRHHMDIYSNKGNADIYARRLRSIKKTLDKLREERKALKLRFSLIDIEAEKKASINKMKRIESLMFEDKMDLSEKIRLYNDKHPKVLLIMDKIASRKQKIAEIKKRLSDIEQKQSTLDELSLNIRTAEQAYINNKTKQDSAALTALTTDSEVNVRVIDYANVEEAPGFPRIFYIAIAFVVSVIMGLSFALLANYYDSSLSGIEDVENALMVPVIASVSKVKWYVRLFRLPFSLF